MPFLFLKMYSQAICVTVCICGCFYVSINTHTYSYVDVYACVDKYILIYQADILSELVANYSSSIFYL